MGKLRKNHYWIILIIIGFWIQLNQTLILIDTLNNIDIQFIASVAGILLSVLVISLGSYLLFEWTDKKNFVMLSGMLFLISIIMALIAVFFHSSFGIIYLLIQIDIMIIGWYQAIKRKK